MLNPPRRSPVRPSVFFDLLAREAAAGEFEAVLADARAAGMEPDRLAALEAEKAAALRVREVLARRARREAELAALFDTAHDLAGLRDVDAVLQAIVHRARRLLATDTAYMTLRDEARGDTYMRVTDGSVSAAFRVLRLPAGAGLGGLVAQTRSPYASTDYFADPRFRHDGSIDIAVREEGLTAILGVPMCVGDRVIGVLFAADRSRRPFAPEDIALLGSLAAHAAVAIDTARLIEETAAANAAIRAHSTEVERAAQVHDRMTDLVVRGGGAAEVAALIAELLGGALLVRDADGRRLAAVGEIGEIDEDALAAAAAAVRSTGRAQRCGPLLVAAAGEGTAAYALLILRTDRDAGPEAAEADRRILERGALITALLLLLRRSVTDTEGRVRGELLDDLLGGRVADPGGLARRAELLQVDLARPHVLVMARHDGQRERAEFWASSHAALARGLSTAAGQEVVLLLPDTDPGAAARYVAAELTAALATPVTAGGAGPITVVSEDPQAVAALYREAAGCVRALLALDRAGEGADATGLGFVGLVLGERASTGAFVDSVLSPVISYDARRGTALVATMDAYFAAGASPARTAQALHVHVNTVAQRLERVAHLLGPGWQSPERALEIQLALRLHRLRTG